MDEKSNGVLLDIKGLRTYFFTDEGVARAVDNVSLTLHEGETLGVVGESGCGKSVTALSIMRLIPQPPGKIVGGEINFADRGDLTKLSESGMRKIRGNEISMIFQEPMTSLNPVFRIGNQIAEAIQLHQKVSKKEALERSVDMLQLVGIPSPEKRVKDYPHQLSGGMRQRVMIAMALSCNPKLMLADEPTTALDVTIQAQILNIMNKLKEEVGTSIILITHNLGVIAEMAQSVSVMYAGVVVENADVYTLFGEPLHPYTIGLLTSIPRADRDAGKKTRLNTIPGIVPSLLELPVGCRFSDRCPHVHEPCTKWEPPLDPPTKTGKKDHLVRCWLHLTPPKG
ncbi:MAG: ABC transporter ATP-binding protein [Deltaproteobacteria bacterium]|nr:ABC transporter ATP-binding protein [Deltaproteobacteria bacterium]MBW2307852.1 ABC transporter ATP-binding protein [Deltaproteobacteria bacterium]